MRIVIDSNRVVAALIKESTTREILFNKDFEFIAPDFIKSEINKYKDDIIKKAKITEKEFDILLSLIFEHITIISEQEYENFIEEIKDEISDIKDIPYLVVSLSHKAEGIWSHDTHFKEQKKVKVFTNIDMLRISGKNSDFLLS